MLDNAIGRSLFALAELSHLRQEAMDLFEQCLTNGDDTPLVSFIEQQLLQDPPRLDLLRDIANDLQQRLLSLREYHFDVRDRVVKTLNDSYDVDITSLTPAALLDQYHKLTPDQILAVVQDQAGTLSQNEAVLLNKMIDASLRMASQLFDDIQLTARLHRMVLDWLEGISIAISKQYWPVHSQIQEKPDKNIRH
ncbi:MAG: hypothetical protein HY866_09825 [Chloroflexi bacterium]|nr:hypothetical protein [Chloroflexota bacterium]